MLILRFAVFTPLKRSFDYLAPNLSTQENLSLKIGTRFLLPFGHQKCIGVLLSIATSTQINIKKLKTPLACLDELPILNANLLKLANWMSSYYHAPIGYVLWLMLPPPLRIFSASSTKNSIPQTRSYKISALGREMLPQIAANAKNRLAFAQLFKKDQNPESFVDKEFEKETFEKELFNKELFEHELSALSFKVRPQLKYFLEQNWITTQTQNPTVLPKYYYALKPNPLLTNAQQDVVNAVINQADEFKVSLLEGVTGSGKTEVYLELAKHFLNKGQQVLILVPEIGLTPQFLARIQNQLQINVLGIHSQLSNLARFEAWLKATLNQIHLVIGTRTALFTPMPNLGMIIIDEEHDASYRSRDGVRYSARDAAIVYAKHLNIPILLGSATPALDSLQNSLNGRYQALFLKQRVLGTMPKWQIIDCILHPQVNGLTEVLIEAIKARLDKNEQVILFLNRRGFAPVLFCQNCKWMADCPACDAHLTLHYNRLSCHHCAYSAPKPEFCPNCQKDSLIALGYGTQRIENALQDIFPDEKIVRIDRDTISKKQDLENALDLINSLQTRIILGTQMIAKGHDFAEVTLVAVIDTDNLLFSHDFRGEEQLAQLLTQVSGRGGRAQKPAQVLIQTYHPEHAIFQDLPKIGYHEYALSLLEKRALFKLPPFSYQAQIFADSKVLERANKFLQNGLDEFEQQYDKLAALLKISPPLSCYMSRRKGYFRAYILVQSHDRNILNISLANLDQILGSLKKQDLRFHIEVDPPESA
ncbi:primosome assembly protein PriA [Gammaproteobacteria bacterium]|nr:primosome assembly protein PriA [Gammaproteobacteria bacterium]